tara:strand:+ start:378 stop:569 length:192 start_codon:yes stop_codon:yes gene_type:complete
LVDFSIKGVAVAFNPTVAIITSVDPQSLVHGVENGVNELLEAIGVAFLLSRWFRLSIRWEAWE